MIVKCDCGFFCLGTKCINKMAALAKPKVPIWSTAGAIPIRNEKGWLCYLFIGVALLLCACMYFSRRGEHSK